MAGFFIYQFKSLKTRLTVFLLLPVLLLLISGGVLNYFFSRNLIIKQWNESTVLKLARAAYSIERRLTGPLNILNALFTEKSVYKGTGRDLVALFKEFSGVKNAVFTADSSSATQGGVRGAGFHRCQITKISNPEFNTSLNEKTVTIAIEIFDRQERTAGILTIEMGFDFLLADVAGQDWWKDFKACLVTREGEYIAHAGQLRPGRSVMGESNDALEKKIMLKISQARSGTVASGELLPKTIAGFYTLEPVPWVLILFGEGETMLAAIIVYRNIFLAISFITVFVIVLLIRQNTGRVVNDIQTLCQRSVDLAGGRYGSPVPVTGRDEISRLVQSYNEMEKGLKERDFIRDSFGRYVDPEFAGQLMERPDKSRLGGERRQVVILMSDLRGFTPMAESQDPEITIEVLNRYFSRIIQIIQSFHGIIVDFFGDAILAFYDPLDTTVSEAANKAMACAFAMQDSMKAVNRDLAGNGLPELFMGIGMHTGPVVVGNIGSHARTKYGIVGSAVNITSRIQARAEPGEILVSDDLLNILPGISISRSFKAELKGIQSPMTLNAVMLRNHVKQNSEDGHEQTGV